MIARSSAYANFLEVVFGKSCILMLNKRGIKNDPVGRRISDVAICFVGHYR